MSTQKSKFTVQCIYMLTDKTNGKIYVGQTRNLTKRLAKHRYVMNHPEAVNKKREYLIYQAHAGENFDEVFEPSILEVVEDESRLNDREVYWIDKLNAMDSEVGYNTKVGGDFVPHKRVAGDKDKYIRRKNAVYVYDSKSNSYAEYESCAAFGEAIGMLGENVADRARNAHLAKNGRYYIFFADLDIRMSYFKRYFNKIYGKLVEDIFVTKLPVRSSINARISYVAKYLEILDKVEKHFDSISGYDYQQIIEHLNSLRINDMLKYIKDAYKNVPYDKKLHRKLSVAAFDCNTKAIQTFDDLPKAAKALGVPYNESQKALKYGIMLRDRWYLYYINEQKRFETFEIIWNAYRLNHKSIKTYALGYFMVNRAK